ncbi:MAG: DNA repair protein RadC [Clostridia bacterium]|jgi:DNA repair protein RadC|nr:DNA repair protein RadC [Clostridia bacterium]
MSIKMKELPESERPYEKLKLYGACELSNAELLAIIIKCGSKEDTSVGLAQKILKLNENKDRNDLKFLQNISLEELTKIKGIGQVKAIQILSVCELAKRMSRPINSLKIVIKNTKDVADLFIEELRYEKRELVKLVMLNTKNVVIKITDIALGGGNFAAIEPKIVLFEPIKMQAQKIILVHNHPSGDPTPSKGDYRITDRISECADIMGITLLDHVVIGDNKFCSLFHS